MTAILISMEDTKEEDVIAFLKDEKDDNGTKNKGEEEEEVEENVQTDDRNCSNNNSSYIPLTNERVEFLLNILDDIRIFV